MPVPPKKNVGERRKRLRSRMYRANARQAENDEQRSIRRDKERVAHAAAREAQTEEERNMHRRSSRLDAAARRQAATDEQRRIQYEKRRIQYEKRKIATALARLAETDEQRSIRLEKARMCRLAYAAKKQAKIAADLRRMRREKARMKRLVYAAKKQAKIAAELQRIRRKNERQAKKQLREEKKKIAHTVARDIPHKKNLCQSPKDLRNIGTHAVKVPSGVSVEEMRRLFVDITDKVLVSPMPADMLQGNYVTTVPLPQINLSDLHVTSQMSDSSPQYILGGPSALFRLQAGSQLNANTPRLVGLQSSSDPPPLTLAPAGGITTQTSSDLPQLTLGPVNEYPKDGVLDLLSKVNAIRNRSQTILQLVGKTSHSSTAQSSDACHLTPKPANGFKCRACDKSYQSQYGANEGVCGRRMFKNQKIKCFDCEKEVFSFPTFQELRNHLSQIHNLDMIELSFELASMREFYSWKTQYEKETESFFVCRHRYMCPGGHKTHWFTCHLNGFLAGQGQSGRHMVPETINRFCTAFITVTELKDVIQVMLGSQHYKHEGGIDEACLINEDASTVNVVESVVKEEPFDDESQTMWDNFISANCNAEVSLEQFLSEPTVLGTVIKEEPVDEL